MKNEKINQVRIDVKKIKDILDGKKGDILQDLGPAVIEFHNKVQDMEYLESVFDFLLIGYNEISDDDLMDIIIKEWDKQIPCFPSDKMPDYCKCGKCEKSYKWNKLEIMDYLQVQIDDINDK